MEKERNLASIEEKAFQLRIREDLTQNEFAKLLGVSTSYVSNWENGYNEIPIVLLNKICNLCNVGFDYMMGLSKKKNMNIVKLDSIDKKYLGKKDIVAIKINPMIIRKVYNSAGHAITNNDLYDETFNRLKKLGYFHLGYNNYFEALKPRFEAYINLDLDYIKLFGNIDRSCRNKIRKAVRDGIKVYHGDIDDLKYLYEQTKGKYPRGLQYFEDLYRFFGKDNLIDFYYSKLDTTDYLQYTQKQYNEYYKKSTELSQKLMNQKGNSDKLISEKLEVDKKVVKYRNQLAEATEYLKNYPDGIITSSALVIKWQDDVYFAIDGYDKKYKHFGAKQLMIWKLMGRYAKLGYKKLYLGGVANINKVNNKYKGLNEFKLNFHANVIEYAGDPPKFQRGNGFRGGTFSGPSCWFL